MPFEALKFRGVGNGRYRVQIWGDFIDDKGVMDLDNMTPFLQHLKLVAITPEEVVQELRDGKDCDFIIEKRKK